MNGQLPYLAGAYAAIWIVFFGYTLYLSRKLKSLEEELKLLED